MAPISGSGINFGDLKTTQDGGFMWSWFRYGQSKLANLIYAKELARRYPNITSVAVHPGVVGTGLVDSLSFVKRWFVILTNFGRFLTPDEGAYDQLWAASTDKKKLVNGGFYEPVGKPGGWMGGRRMRHWRGSCGSGREGVRWVLISDLPPTDSNY
ncbi:hypothetical protein BJX99DRAFT_155037 [Aspergillus californicus]